MERERAVRRRARGVCFNERDDRVETRDGRTDGRPIERPIERSNDERDGGSAGDTARERMGVHAGARGDDFPTGAEGRAERENAEGAGGERLERSD